MSLHTYIDRTETKFDHICFIPLGTVVDGVTVAKAVWPDSVPTSNYLAFKMKELESVKPEITSESESRLYVSETTPGYVEDTTTTRKAKSYTGETSRTNGLVKMLEYGLAAFPVPGTAQVPGERKETYVDGVMLKETGVVGLGVITERLHVWARFELVSLNDTPNKTSKIQFKITEMESDNNTFEMPVLV